MPRARPRHIAALAGVVVALVAGVLAGCGADQMPPTAEPSGTTTGEVAEHDGSCPQRLPQGADDDDGFGTSKPAAAAPSLPAPDRAWVCQYDPEDVGPGPDGAASYAWVRSGGIRAVPSTRLPVLAQALAALKPGPENPICTADLGPRMLVVYPHGAGLIGVAVDSFGCRSVRLTDDPFHTEPGEGTSAGTVPGVLADVDGLLAESHVLDLSVGSDELVLRPYGVGRLALGMAPDQIAGTGVATSEVGSAHDGWAPGCRILQYRPDVFGTIPDDTLNGTVSPNQGLEQLYATSRMSTPEGIRLGSTIAEVRAAYDRPKVIAGDLVVVRASDRSVYRIQVEHVVTSISVEWRHLDCER